MVEKAEQALLDMGFKEMRVRCHGKLARIEVAENDFAKAAAQRKEISAAVKNAGFLYAALDLEGFRSGSLNAALENKNRIINALAKFKLCCAGIDKRT